MNERDNPPRLVNWAGYLAITFVLLLPVSVLTVRSGAWQQGLMLYALACLGATLVMLVCITLLLLPRFAAWRKNILQRGLIALPGTLLLQMLDRDSPQFVIDKRQDRVGRAFLARADGVEDLG
jgi:membrane protein YdbS with pleckstrin-like domain